MLATVLGDPELTPSGVLFADARRADVQGARRPCRRSRGSGRCGSGKRRCRWVVAGRVVILVGRFVDVVTAGASALPAVLGGPVLLSLATGMSIAVVAELDFLVERTFTSVDPDTAEVSFGSTGGFSLIADVVAETLGISK